jgi:hypothetical protein
VWLSLDLKPAVGYLPTEQQKKVTRQQAGGASAENHAVTFLFILFTFDDSSKANQSWLRQTSFILHPG